jgi:glutathione S-transferase
MNLQHTIPTLDDGGFYINESRAMLSYLANKYGKDLPKLYPSDPKGRAKVDMKLAFDMGTLYSKFGDAYVSLYIYTLSIIFCVKVR